MALNGRGQSMQLYSVAGVRLWARLTLGEKQPLKQKVGVRVLMSSDTSSLVVDRLCDRAKEENTSVACFYVDFVARIMRRQRSTGRTRLGQN